MRQVFLDTETTGLSTLDGNRIIEIACVEMIDRKITGRTYHRYINPQCEIDSLAIQIHGINNEFLMYQPIFQQIVEEFVTFIEKAELVIHNAEFDLEFLDYEFSLIDTGCYPVLPMRTWCPVIDTLEMARQKHAGQKNNLDALCDRYNIKAEDYDFSGALQDARMLSDVYLAMTSSDQDRYVAGVRRRTMRMKDKIRQSLGYSRGSKRI